MLHENKGLRCNNTPFGLHPVGKKLFPTVGFLGRSGSRAIGSPFSDGKNYLEKLQFRRSILGALIAILTRRQEIAGFQWLISALPILIGSA